MEMLGLESLEVAYLRRGRGRVACSDLEMNGIAVKRLDAKPSGPIFAPREFLDRDRGLCLRERTLLDVLPLLAPEALAYALALQVFESPGVVERPRGGCRGLAPDLVPQRRLGREEPGLRFQAEAIGADIGSELLGGLESAPNDVFAVPVVAPELERDRLCAERVVDAWEDQRVEGLRERRAQLIEEAILQGVEGAPLGIVRRRRFGVELVLDALQRAHLARRVVDVLNDHARAGQEDDSVLERLMAPPALPLLAEGQATVPAAGLGQHKHDLVLLEVNLVESRENRDGLVGVPHERREAIFEELSQLLEHRLVVERLRRGPQLRGEVLLVLEEEPAVLRSVQVPSARIEDVEHRPLERREVTTWSLEEVV